MYAPAWYMVPGMCRSIKKLRDAEQPATSEEIQAAALQFVRKVSGYRSPSRVNGDAFRTAVEEVAGSTQRLLEALTSRELNGSAVGARGV